MNIDPNRSYRPSDPALRDIAKPGTLAAWRHLGVGPSYIKIGSRVIYLGADILAWLESRRVDTSGGSK